MGRIFPTRQPDDIQIKREKEVKMQACLALKRLALRYGMSQNQMALRLGISRSSVSRMMNLRVENISYDQLFRSVTRLAPNFKFLISV